MRVTFSWLADTVKQLKRFGVKRREHVRARAEAGAYGLPRAYSLGGRRGRRRLGFRAVRVQPLIALIAVGVSAAAMGGGAALARDGAPPVPRWPVWLCLPGAPHDWCQARLTTTVITATGKQTTMNPSFSRATPIDCFYVYPTVSLEPRANSNLAIQPAEEDVAVDEASPLSEDCRVFAPMYNQVTTFSQYYRGVDYELEYTDILKAWRDYLAHYNDGRGVVLIGHSEGAFLLERLIREQIEPSASERKLLVSAILVGGDVTVADHGEGGDMPTIPPCASKTQTGCIVAYSTFDTTPPQGSGFEQVDDPATEHVLCVNPADPGSLVSEPVTPWFPSFDSAGFAPLDYGGKFLWIEFPDLYTARCVDEGSRAWLLVTRIHNPGDRRPMVQVLDGPDWGLHEGDLTVALPELVTLVGDQSSAYLAHTH